MSRGHAPVIIQEFNGLFDRGTDDVVPLDHFQDCLNIRFTQLGCNTRGGISLNTSLADIVRVHLYTRIGEAQRLLILDSNGDLYDSGNSLVTPILSIATMVDFSAITLFNRAYITPHDRTSGIQSEFVYVYSGTGTARKIGGVAPSTALAAATSATAGNVEAGVHLIRYIFETDSGFLTQGSDAVSYTAPGGFKVDLSSVDVGGAQVTARHILATKIITNYSGRVDDYEFFFVPNGKIDNNIATTITVNFYDNDLVASADYLLDQLAELPSGVFVTAYQGSLVVGGEYGKESVVRVSRPGEPESFSEVDGFLLVNPGDAGEGVKTAIEYRDLLHIFKSQRTYVTRNNGNAPATWDVNLIDNGIGTECFGASLVLDSLGNTQDRFLIADPSGLVAYVGTYGDKPLSWKIYDVWNRINKQYFSKIQVCIDPTDKVIYVNVPLDAATEPSHVLICDYKNGLSAETVRWSLDSYSKKPTSIFVRSVRSSSDLIPRLEFGSSDDNTYILLPTNTDDAGTAIDSYANSALVYSSAFGRVNHFTKLQFRVTGSGTLILTVKGEDGVKTATPPSITLAASPGIEPFRLINFINEKMAVKWRTNALAAKWAMNRVMIFSKELWDERPH
jgi:hypothetical protein